MGGISSVAAAAFGVVWTLIVVSARGPWFMALFGVIFIALAVAQAVYNFKNATSKNRYSSFDVVDSNEEPDPFNERFGNQSSTGSMGDRDDDSGLLDQAEDGHKYCPYCGAETEPDYEYCASCGKKLP